jgi:hypothetical protein
MGNFWSYITDPGIHYEAGYRMVRQDSPELQAKQKEAATSEYVVE